MTKRLLFIAILILMSSLVRCQLFHSESLGILHYEEGTNQLRIGDYIAADSLLSLALCSFKNENVYYNRAISRLMLNDTIGFCDDMDIAANRYFDFESEVNFNDICCKCVDTIYYDKKMNIVDTAESNHRYYEIIKSLKYDSSTIGTFHDVKSSDTEMHFDYGCSNELLGIHSGKTNIIAIYLIDEHSKYYVKTTTSPSIYNIGTYEEIQERGRQYLSIKYEALKTKNNVDKLKVYFEIFFDSQGEISDFEYLGFFPEIFIDSLEEELEKDLLDIVQNYPNVKPAKFFKNAVPCKTYDFITF